MKAALWGTAAVAFVAVVVSQLAVHPQATIHKVFPVFVLWVASWAANALMIGVVVKRRSVADRAFWAAFWGSGVALVVNTLAPLLLLFALPVWTVAGVEALNVAGNLPAIPFRRWAWKTAHIQTGRP